MTLAYLELEMLLDLPIPLDQILWVEARGAQAHDLGMRLGQCPYGMDHMIHSDPRVPAVSARALWSRGWLSARDDAAIARKRVG